MAVGERSVVGARGIGARLRTIIAVALVATPLVLDGAPASAVVLGDFEIDGDREAGTDTPPSDDWGNVAAAGQTDPAGEADESVFTQGTNELTDPTEWTLGGASPTGVGDITAILEFDRVVANEEWVFIGIERFQATGNTAYRIELNTNPNIVNPQGVSAPDRVDGDRMLQLEGTGTDLSPSGVFRWDGDEWVETAQQFPFAFAISDDGLFVEMAFNFTTLGLVRGCDAGFYRAVNIRSAASPGFTSSLRDYAEPDEVEIPPRCAFLEIEKMDEEGELLPGATFEIDPDPNDGEGTLVVTDGSAEDLDGVADGVINVDTNIFSPPPYTVTEVEPPPGYIADPDPQQWSAQPFGETMLTFENTLGSVSFEKVDATTGDPVCCATFVLTKAAGDPVEDPITVVDNQPPDADPEPGEVTVEDLTTGSWTVTETVPPQGYDLPDPASQDFTISADDPNATLAVPFEDPRIPVDLTARKLDAVTGELIDTAVFQLWRESGDTEGFQPDEDVPVDEERSTTGGSVTWEDLQWGTYYVEETQAPDGYELPEPPPVQTVVLGRGDAGTTVTVDFEDPRIPATLLIVKVDEAGEPLPGVKIEIDPDPTDGEGTLEVADGGTGDLDGQENGVIELETVRFESSPITVTETVAPPGYIRDATPQEWMPTPGSETTLMFVNSLGSVSFEKVDATNREPVCCATFELTKTAGDPAQEPITVIDNQPPDTDPDPGGVTVEGLTTGLWTVTETDPPEDYLLPNPASQDFTISAATPDPTLPEPFADPRDPATLSIEKVDADGTLLPGATFSIELDPTDGTGTLTVTDGGARDLDGEENGVIELETVRFESSPFTVTETVAPPGYIRDATPQEWTPTPGSETTLTFENTLGSVTFQKLDTTSDDPVCCATFVLEKTAGDPADDPIMVVDNRPPDADPADGQVTVEDLTTGSWRVTETVPPDDYLLPEDPTKQFRIGESSQDPVVLAPFSDPRLPPDLSIEKVDEAGELLLGATFEISPDPSDGQGTLIVTDGGEGDQDGEANGVIAVERELFEFRTFTVTEVEAPVGYIRDATPQEWTPTPGSQTTLTFENTFGSVTFQKVDAITGDPVCCATFVLTKTAGDPPQDPITVVDSRPPDVDADPGGITVEGLTTGSWTVTETVPPDGYQLPDDPIREFTIGEASPAPVLAPFADPQVPVNLTVEKRDPVTGRPLDTAAFQLWREVGTTPELQPDEDIAVGDPVSTGGGTVTWTNLEWGTYYIEETEAPIGYELLEEPVAVVLDRGNAGATASVSVEDPRTPTDVVVDKRDAASRVPLLGATFQLWSDVDANRVLDTTIDRRILVAMTTGASGRVSWQGLDFGTYIVEETVAPAGYTRPEPTYQAFSITRRTAGETQILAFLDEAVTRPVPPPAPPGPTLPLTGAPAGLSGILRAGIIAVAAGLCLRLWVWSSRRRLSHRPQNR